MRLSDVITSLAALAQLSSAFYPYILGSNSVAARFSTRDISQDKRSLFHPQSSPTVEDGLSDASSKSTTPQDLENGLMRISLQRQPAKRLNKFNVLQAVAPKQRNSVGVDQDGADNSYFASFKFGSSTKTLYLLLDSAASNTWIMSSDCSTRACGVHTTFGPSDSSSLQVAQTAFSVVYGTGSVKGVQGSDIVQLGGMSAPLTFGLAQSVSDEFLSYPIDGILGLGRPDTLASDSTGVKAPSIMDALVSQNVIGSKLYGLTLWRSTDGGNNDGEINFGSPDTSRYDGDLNYLYAIKGTNGFWEVPLADAGVDGKKVGINGRTAIIDSGTSFILMPKDDAVKLHQAVPGSSQNGESFTVPCDARNKIQMIFGTLTYDISPKDYIGRQSGSGCASNIVGRQVFGSKQWLVGDVFMKNVYTVFDYDQQRVGFGVKRSSVSKSESSPVADSNTAQAQATQNSQPTATGLSTGSGYIGPNGLLPGAASSTTTSDSRTGTAATTTSSSRTGAASKSKILLLEAALLGLIAALL